MRTLQGEHEVVERILVLLVRLGVVLLEILVYRALHEADRALWTLDAPARSSLERGGPLLDASGKVRIPTSV